MKYTTNYMKFYAKIIINTKERFSFSKSVLRGFKIFRMAENKDSTNQPDDLTSVDKVELKEKAEKNDLNNNPDDGNFC